MLTTALGLGCGELSPTLVIGTPRRDAGSFSQPVPSIDASVLGRADGGATVDGSVGSGPAYDLSPTRGSAPAETLPPGATLSFSVRVENFGSATTPDSLARAVLVPTGRYEGLTPIEIASGVVPSLAPGAGLDLTLDGRVPTLIASARYRLAVQVDPGDLLDEIDEDNNELQMLEIDIGHLEVTPRQLDFGAVAPGCEAKASFTLTQLGATRARVRSATLDGAPELSLEPVSFPFYVLSGASFSLGARFRPLETGTFRAQLALGHDELVQPQLLTLTGIGVEQPERVETLAQRSGPVVDVVLIVQNGCPRSTCTLAQRQGTVLADYFDRLYETLVDTRADWRILVTTTDPSPGRLGRLVGAPLDASTPNLALAFQSLVTVGVAGSQQPSGLAAAEAVLSGSDLRPEAAVDFIIFALDDDRSGSTPEDWQDRLVDAADADRLTLNGFIPDPTGTLRRECPDEPLTPRYEAAIRGLNGVVANACDDGIQPYLRLSNFDGFGLDRQFRLTWEPVDPENIALELDGVDYPEVDPSTGRTRWRYLSAPPSIEFDRSSIPPAGSRIRVRYRSKC